MNSFKPFFILLFFSLIINISAQDYYMTSPVGFGRNSTGGENGKIVTVNTRETLKTALKASGAAIIIVTDNINFGEGEMISEVVTNKTLLGLKGVKLITTAQVANGGILGLKEGSNNVIIRNLIFEGPGAYDVDGRDLLTNTGCSNLWVDHCEFYDGVDGNFDNTKKADNITISWCKFGYNKPPKAGGSGGSNDHRFSNLVGGASNDYPADGHYSITFQYCYWADGCKQRMPRARNAELHILNCYYNTNTSSSLAIGLEDGTKGTTCYVEGTNFKKVSKVYDRSYGGSPDITLVNCLNGGSSAGNTVQKPSYPYTAIDVNNVESVITDNCGAGATLDITSTGEISSPCQNQPPLTIPTNVNAISTSNAITVNWDAVEEATGYRVKICHEDENNASDIIRQWDFTTWSIDENDADANLILDSGNRLNYKPSTNSTELTFSNGNKIPDTEGLFFTAGADTKLRLGFATGLLYLNGSGIKVAIPCEAGNFISIEGMAGNAEATNRGFSVTGATVDNQGTSNNISNGILTVAAAEATWSYIATGNTVVITTTGGGMNISKITVSPNSAPSTIFCDEYDIDKSETSQTISDLTAGMEYTYQVKAIRDTEETEYSMPQTITVEGISDLISVSAGYHINQVGNCFIVSGADIKEMSLYNMDGKKIIKIAGSQTIDVSCLPDGFYILSLRTNEGLNKSHKVIKQ